MPPRKPADVWEVADEHITPPTPHKPATTTASTPKPPPALTPPGPINLEIRAGHVGDQPRTALAQRVYSYDIQQTDDYVNIRGYLKPEADL